MRTVIDSLVALMLAAVLAGYVLYSRAEDEGVRDVAQLTENVRALQREVILQAALGEAELTATGFPMTLSPKWFDEGHPINPLFKDGDQRPWVEIASEDEQHLKHPADRAVTWKNAATFWYNPHLGIVRARVPGDGPETRSLQTYNTVNGTHLVGLFSDREMGDLLAVEDGARSKCIFVRFRRNGDNFAFAPNFFEIFFHVFL